MPWAEKDMAILAQHAERVGLAMPLAALIGDQISAIKQAKAAWTGGAGGLASMESFLRAHP